MELPTQGIVPATIGPWSWQSMGRVLMMGGGRATPASGAWPSANLGLLMPIYLEGPAILYKFGFYAGAAPTGDVDMALLDEQLRPLVSVGATAVGAASAVQHLNVTDTPLLPGTYYLDVSASATTITCVRYAGGSVELLRIAGMLQVASHHPIGAGPFTPAAVANLYVPSVFAAFAPNVL